MNIFQKLFLRAKTGYGVQDLGAVNEVVIHYKDIYISLLVSAEGDDKGEVRSIAFAGAPPSHYPVREILEVNV